MERDIDREKVGESESRKGEGEREREEKKQLIRYEKLITVYTYNDLKDIFNHRNK